MPNGIIRELFVLDTERINAAKTKHLQNLRPSGSCKERLSLRILTTFYFHHFFFVFIIILKTMFLQNLEFGLWTWIFDLDSVLDHINTIIYHSVAS